MTAVYYALSCVLPYLTSLQPDEFICIKNSSFAV